MDSINETELHLDQIQNDNQNETSKRLTTGLSSESEQTQNLIESKENRDFWSSKKIRKFRKMSQPDLFNISSQPS